MKHVYVRTSARIWWAPLEPVLLRTFLAICDAGSFTASRPILAAGALKHAFDVCYYPCLDATRGRPFGLYLHGNEGTEGAEGGVTAITTGLGWVRAAKDVVVSGKPSKADLDLCWELGATVAAQLMG